MVGAKVRKGWRATPVSSDIRHQPVAQPAVVATTRPVLRCLVVGVVEPSISPRRQDLPRCIALARRSLATMERGALPGKPWHSKLNPRTTVQATCTQSGGGISRGAVDTLGGVCEARVRSPGQPGAGGRMPCYTVRGLCISTLHVSLIVRVLPRAESATGCIFRQFRFGNWRHLCPRQVFPKHSPGDACKRQGGGQRYSEKKRVSR